MNELPDEINFLIQKNSYDVCCGAKAVNADNGSGLLLANNFCKSCANLLSAQVFAKAKREFFCGHCFKKHSNAESFIPKLCFFCSKKHNKCQNCCGDIK